MRTEKMVPNFLGHPVYAWEILRENAAGNAVGVGKKLSTIPRDGNVIAKNLAVAVGRVKR